MLKVFLPLILAFQIVQARTPIERTPVISSQQVTALSQHFQFQYRLVLNAFRNTPEFPYLLMALSYLEESPQKFDNKNYVTLINYKKSALEKRFFVINLKTGAVEKHYVANGRNTDPDHDGFANSFSNEDESLQTSLGLFVTLDDYFSDKFESNALRLDGLSRSNSNALDRAIVIHGADYVNPRAGNVGRSYGCPALEPAVVGPVVRKIKDGSLIFAFY